MAYYKRYLFYKKNNGIIQTQYVSDNLTLEYNIEGIVSNTLSILYDILAVDARSLWEPKVPGQALWESPPQANPTFRPISQGSVTVGALLLENGAALLLENGAALLLE